ncbi:hypothetical protein AS850_05315 [Frondihabitans sp. 762G35]|uniref:hypothetical protein n=1 Tax=Frondihabitans sp. 762G35 TaxID=1446794 RepID=UPI000D22CCC7|nr:hypothetical protein [Frondihabitans sp. 762G35]ARC56491.1 hypothetical protein AS850_05315 [Frondihabitans sp. 762G35]
MTTVTRRWTRTALLARLRASDAIDRDTLLTPRERAECRVELFRIASDVDAGRLDSVEAEERFSRLSGLLLVA